MQYRKFDRRMQKIIEKAPVIKLNEKSKIILFSDLHRGCGDYSDAFLRNRQVFASALRYYYEAGYTYIELGDGDELWENRNFEYILEAHGDIFGLMSEMYQRDRLFMLYGNHDFYCEVNRCRKELFPDIQVEEGVILENCNGNKLLLVHGHQCDLMNDRLWWLGRFLVRYLWRPLNIIGLIEPTSAAKNHKKKNKLEKRMIRWSGDRRTILISGHTHRASYPCPGETFSAYDNLYFNTGSCVHPRCITGIEIQNGEISLVKWCISANRQRVLSVEKDILEGPCFIEDYFVQKDT